jgi:hypothetical protein
MNMLFSHPDLCKPTGETAQNKYKFEGVEYQPVEIEQARLLAKNVNGIVFMTDALARMYPDVTFFGLVRDGRALCESHIRRGAAVRWVAQLYRHVARAMVEYQDTYQSFHIIQFEDLVQRPKSVLDFVYEKAGLSRKKVRKIHLQVKERTTAEGDRRRRGSTGRLVPSRKIGYPLRPQRQRQPDCSAQRC